MSSEHDGITGSEWAMQTALLSGQMGVGLSSLSMLAPPNVNKSHRNQWTILWSRLSLLRPMQVWPTTW